MARPGRLDFYGAIHYVSLQGRPGGSIFFEPNTLSLPHAAATRAAPDLRYFEHLLAQSCDECGSVVHAFSWQPNSGVLVMQTYGVPLSSVIGRLCGRYSKYLHRRQKIGTRLPEFRSRYDSKVVTPQYLPHAIRRAERAPADAGLCKSPLDYPFSSCRRLGDARPVWLSVSPQTMARPSHRGDLVASGHPFASDDQTETQYIRELFERGSKLDSRVIGDRVAGSRIKLEAARSPPTPSRGQITEAVNTLLRNSSVGSFPVGSQEALRKALVARYAVRSGAATLTEVGRWFAVTPAALRDGINRYRELLPSLFHVSLEELFDSGIAA